MLEGYGYKNGKNCRLLNFYAKTVEKILVIWYNIRVYIVKCGK